MSVTDDEVLACLEFKEFLNEHCFSRISFVQWISDDEFLLVFDSHFIVYRLTPFYKAVSVTDKFPVSIMRFEFDGLASPSILQHCLNLLKYPEVDANYARATSDLTRWREVSLTLADPVFLPSSLCCAANMGAASDTESTTTIAAIHVESVADDLRHLFFTTLLDGRMFVTSKTGAKKRDTISTTSLLYDYIYENMDVCRSIVSDLPDPSQPIEQATDLNGLKKILKMGKFLSTKYWLSTDLRYSKDSPDSYEKVGISLHRSGHLVLWQYNQVADCQNIRISNVLDPVTDKPVSAATVLLIDHEKCLLLLGTTEGGLFSYSVDISTRKKKRESNRLQELSLGDCKLAVSAMRLFPLANSEHLLVLSQQYFLTAATLVVSSNGSINVTASKTLRTDSRLAITEFIRHGGAFYVLSPDKVSKYAINCEKGIILKALPDTTVPLDKARIVGMVFSWNKILRLDAVMKRLLDRYAMRKPLTLRILCLLGPEELWAMLTVQGSLKKATDFMVLLRYYVLHHEQSKIIGDLLMKDLESMESKDDDSNVLVKLKIFRFATTVFSGKRSKAEELEFWNRVREKVERLLVVKVAKHMLERARLLDWRKPMPFIRQSTAAVIDLLSSATGVEVANEFGELQRPQCPLCNTESFQSIMISDHACVNNHRYPACSLTFLPIPSFSYRKCIRCDLAALDRESIEELTDLIPEPDYCQFCDGRMLPV